MLFSRAAHTQTSSLQAQADAANLLILEVQIDQSIISDAMNAYQFDRNIFLPIGELSSLLTIALRAQPAKGRVSGFVLTEDHSFDLDVPHGTVTIGTTTNKFDPTLIRVMPDDIYVATQLLQSWLPLRLNTDLSRLRLVVQATEPLPLRLQRQRLATSLGSAKPDGQGLGFPKMALPYALISMPFINQTVSSKVDRVAGKTTTSVSSTTYMTADVAGMEAAVYYTAGANTGTPADFRMTLGRNDPDAGMLGPLNARSYSFGSTSTLGVSNIARSNATGNGLTFSNMPLTRATSFDTQIFQGPLPPGWDVELYFNDALVGYQQSRADGKYVFADQQLIFGNNQFRLVFHGPQGQVRVEK
ncbi:MAG: hypothetical protein MO853_00345 [Candidatus Protistobacter heckmanni]|nr:hypothetical protein [Candidatus Protistobacter heckmanni]